MNVRAKWIAACLIVAACGAVGARAQQAGTDAAAAPRTGETRAALAEQAPVHTADGAAALAARLLTTQLAGTPDAPALNSRFAVENRGPLFYTYMSGWATYYDASGVRCGEGLWTLPALAPGETAETDTPGLRLTCTPAYWRVVATTLLTRPTETARPVESAPARPAAPPVQPLEININGRTIPIQLGNPLEITVGRERVRIVLNPAP